jgi:hypothetical protein
MSCLRGIDEGAQHRVIVLAQFTYCEHFSDSRRREAELRQKSIRSFVEEMDAPI